MITMIRYCERSEVIQRLARKDSGLLRCARNNNQAGFTLIELIAVISILSIIAVIGVSFIVTSVESYQQTQTRAQLLNQSRQAIERMSRQLRGALPYSINLSTPGCVKFMPLASGGYYLNPVPDTANDANATDSIETATFGVDFGTAHYAVIGATTSTEIYNGDSSASLSTQLNKGFSGSDLTLASNKQWQRNSIRQRFFLVDHPQAFCVVGNELHFLQGSGLGWTPSGTGSLMAKGVSGGFSLQSGTESRNAIVALALQFAANGESISLNHEVHIRNVP